MCIHFSNYFGASSDEYRIKHLLAALTAEILHSRKSLKFLTMFYLFNRVFGELYIDKNKHILSDLCLAKHRHVAPGICVYKIDIANREFDLQTVLFTTSLR